MSWPTRKRDHYTARGILRLRCVRCEGPALHEWSVCADGNVPRPLCGPCDVELNAIVLLWAGHPDAERLIAEYRAKVGRQMREAGQ